MLFHGMVIFPKKNLSISITVDCFELMREQVNNPNKWLRGQQTITFNIQQG